ncbi:MAG: ATP-binding protein [Lachnospiraceae bacterium]|nr:ATP-binding protein [Lachnospiraceae bacterium]
MLSSRKRDLSLLSQIYKKGENEAVIVYGAMGLGKTRMVNEFCKDKNHFYYMAKQASELQQKIFFSTEIKNQFQIDFDSIEYKDALDALLRTRPGKFVLVIDEFQFIAKKDDEFIKTIVELLKDQDREVMVILVSSQIGWIGSELPGFMKYNSSTKLFVAHKMEEIGFVDLVQTLERYDTRECVKIYGIIGGIPKYIDRWNKNRSIKDNVCKLILSPNGILYNEVDRIIGAELREQSVYNTILYALATDKNKLNDLYAYTGFSRAKISVYINNLIDLDIVEKVDSYETAGKVNTKKGVYQIRNTIVNFYYRFIYSNLSDLNTMPESEFYETYIEPNLNAYLDRYFVKVCQEYLLLLSKIGKLPITISKIGSWIGKQGNIDIIASDEEGKAIIGLCRWKDRTVTYSMCLELFDLMGQAKISADYYYLFSSKSFDEKLKKEAEKEPRIILVDISSL